MLVHREYITAGGRQLHACLELHRHWAFAWKLTRQKKLHIEKGITGTDMLAVSVGLLTFRFWTFAKLPKTA